MIVKSVCIAILMMLGSSKGSQSLRKLQIESDPNYDEVKVVTALAVKDSNPTQRILKGIIKTQELSSLIISLSFWFNFCIFFHNLFNRKAQAKAKACTSTYSYTAKSSR
jgi:hypothetical protein